MTKAPKLSHPIGSDLVWAAFLALLGLALGLMIQWGVIQHGWQGTLDLQIAAIEKEEAARRLAAIRTYTLDQALTIHQEGRAVFIDAREPEEYRELHIDRALNLPASQISPRLVAATLAGVSREQPIVVYCGSVDCHASLRVAEFLQKQGYTQVAVYVGGFRAWDEAGYPVDIVR